MQTKFVFKFILHNIIIRKRVLEQSTFIVQQKLEDSHLTLSDLKEKLQTGDQSIANKILYFSANLRGTSQDWNQRSKDLRALIQFKIPSFFTTGSCAEFYFKPLNKLLSMYIKVITKLPNSEQSYKGKVQTHNYINRQNQSTTGKL